MSTGQDARCQDWSHYRDDLPKATGPAGGQAPRGTLLPSVRLLGPLQKRPRLQQRGRRTLRQCCAASERPSTAGSQRGADGGTTPPPGSRLRPATRTGATMVAVAYLAGLQDQGEVAAGRAPETCDHGNGCCSENGSGEAPHVQMGCSIVPTPSGGAEFSQKRGTGAGTKRMSQPQ